MRSEHEVLAMTERFERFNEAAAKQLTGCADDELDNIATTFNHNTQLICALRWCLGEDTIQIREAAKL